MVATTGCIPALQNRVPAEEIPPNRLVAVPPQVLIYTLDASDKRSFDDQAAEAVAGTAREVIRGIVNQERALFADPEALVACGLPCARLFRWGGLATLEIGLQREQIKNFGFHSVTNWRFHGDLSAVRASLGADFMLFVTLKQTRQTTGRQILYALGGTYTYGKQIDAACVADLRDGAMVWCTSRKDEDGDIAAPGRVLQVIQAMLRELFVRVPASS